VIGDHIETKANDFYV